VLGGQWPGGGLRPRAAGLGRTPGRRRRPAGREDPASRPQRDQGSKAPTAMIGLERWWAIGCPGSTIHLPPRRWRWDSTADWTGDWQMASTIWLLSITRGAKVPPVFAPLTAARPPCRWAFTNPGGCPAGACCQEQGRTPSCAGPVARAAVAAWGCPHLCLLWPHAPGPALAYGLATDWLRQAMEERGRPLRLRKRASACRPQFLFVATALRPSVMPPGVKTVAVLTLEDQGQFVASTAACSSDPCRPALEGGCALPSIAQLESPAARGSALGRACATLSLKGS